jgi:hypothetical protein
VLINEPNEAEKSEERVLSPGIGEEIGSGFLLDQVIGRAHKAEQQPEHEEIGVHRPCRREGEDLDDALRHGDELIGKCFSQPEGEYDGLLLKVCRTPPSRQAGSSSTTMQKSRDFTN